MATKNFAVRVASVGDLNIPTRLGVMEDWHLGCNDLVSFHTFDPSGFFVGELDGEIISHINAVKYPSHSSFIGAFVVLKEHRGKGYGKQTWDVAWESLDKRYTIGLDATNKNMVAKYESHGFRPVWNTLMVSLDLQKIIDKISGVESQPGISLKPIKSVDVEKLLVYDTSVFGTPRQSFIEKWINNPGNVGWAAVNEKEDVTGYAVVRQIIADKGADIQLGMAPLYADDDQIARALLKVAAETYQANEAICANKFELFCGDGGSYGRHASQLMTELEADCFLIGQRMYTGRIPPGRQQTKMYGIVLPAFD